MKKKLISCMLATVMVVSCLSGCGNQTQGEEANTSNVNEETSASTASTSTASSEVEEIKLGYPIEGDVTLTIAIPVDPSLQARAKDISETAGGKLWQEKTGINLEVVTYADTTALNLLITSGELPDIICGHLETAYPGGPTAAVEDGVIQPITDYMQYAPNLQAFMDSDPTAYKDSLTGNGEIAGFLSMSSTENKNLMCTRGMLLRKDLLDKVGMDVPKSADDLYNVLKAFKEQLNVQYPLTTQSTFVINDLLKEGGFTSPFNLVKGDFYVKDGKVHYGFYENEMKDALAFLNKLVDEELLNPNYTSIDGNAVTSDMVNGVSAMAVHYASRAYIWPNAAEEANIEGYEIIGVAPLQTADGQIAMSGQYVNSRTYGGYITTSCENIEAAVRFLDWGYNTENALLFAYGVEGITYRIDENGLVETHLEEETKLHPDWTQAEVNSYYKLAASNSAPYMSPLADYPELMTEDVQRMYDARDQYKIMTAEDYYLPKLTAFISEEDNAEIADLMGDINTYRDETVTKFILGTESLDNFAEYQKVLKDMGIETVIELYQKALDKYYQY